MHSLVVVDSSAKLLAFVSYNILYKCTSQLSVVVDMQGILHTGHLLMYSHENWIADTLLWVLVTHS